MYLIPTGWYAFGLGFWFVVVQFMRFPLKSLAGPLRLAKQALPMGNKFVKLQN
jgi:hypothetical protein